MDFSTQSKADAFDTLFTTNHIRILKALLPYMDNQMQKNMVIYIKFLELRYAIDFLVQHPYPLCGCTPQKNEFDFSKVCTDILPYCNEKERKQIEQFQGIFRGMEMYREISKTMEMMKEFMPEGDMGNLFGGLFSSDDSSGNSSAQSTPDFMNLFMNMLSDDQKEMFQILNN